MANYKLINNNFWETSGVYDIGQAKTQRQINAEVVDASNSISKTKTVSGNLVSFDDGVEGVPLKNLTVNIEPVQSGTGDPSPTNIRPITGWTGVNVYRSDADTSNPTIYSITFPASPGTVYGGTLDVTNGVLTVDRVCYTVQSSLFVDYGATSGGIKYVRTAASYASADPNKIPISNMYLGTTGSTTDKRVRFASSRIYVYDNSFSSLEDAQTLFNANPLQVVSPRRNPVTYQLTPTEIKMLLGQNNFWADTGDVNVEYGAYFAMVENQLGEKIPKIAIAPIEKTTTASKAYAVNEMFFMGDKLYIATAAIASGATFTVGTNCDETTVGAILTSLLNA